MAKKGLSPVVATLLLVALSVILAGIIFSFNKETLSSFSPSVDCQGVNFKAEILREDSTKILAVVNLGTVELGGFLVKAVREGEMEAVGSVEILVEPGATELVEMTIDLNDNVYLVLPMILSGDELVVCSDNYGFEIEVGAVG